MVNFFPGNSGRPSSGSFLDRWMKRHDRHPEEFDCGVRVVAGEVPGRRSRWRFRVSAFDRHGPPGLVVLHHGADCTLTVCVDRDTPPRSGPRPAQLVLTATEVHTGATVELSLPVDAAQRLIDDAG